MTRNWFKDIEGLTVNTDDSGYKWQDEKVYEIFRPPPTADYVTTRVLTPIKQTLAKEQIITPTSSFTQTDSKIPISTPKLNEHPMLKLGLVRRR